MVPVSASNFLEDMKGADDQVAESDTNSTKWPVGLITHLSLFQVSKMSSLYTVPHLLCNEAGGPA